MSVICKCGSINQVVKQKDESWKCKKCKNVVPKHAHRWQLTYHSTKVIGEWCARKGCGERREREPTPLEKKQIAQAHKRTWKETGDLHKVWHDFQKRFMVKFEFRQKGFEFMCAVEKWAKKYPDDVHVLGCDDSHHMGSDLVLIEHKTPRSWMGVTVVYIGQNGDPCVQFFLYPGHVTRMIKVLQGIEKRAKEWAKREREDDRRRRKLNPFG